MVVASLLTHSPPFRRHVVLTAPTDIGLVPAIGGVVELMAAPFH